MEQLELELQKLKDTNEAPAWMTNEGYRTLLGGYLLPNETPRQMYERVSKGASKYIKEPKIKDKFFNILWKNWLCLASPVCSNFNTDRALPISCNSIHVDDSVDSIFNKNHELAMLSKNGAGVGIYVGDIRGRGTNITGNGKSEGVIPWLKCFDSTTMAVSQGCYDEQTEILTEIGWLSFSELEKYKYIKVASVTNTGALEFTKYTDYIKYKVNEDLYHFTNDNGSVDILVTGNHRMAIEKRKRISNVRKNGKFLNNKKQHTNKLDIVLAENLKLHRDNSFWVAAKNTIESYNPFNNLHRFKIAYQADGSTKYVTKNEKTSSYVFHFKKYRKIDRLKDILDSLEFDYTFNIQKDESVNITVKVPNHIILSKKLSDMFNLKTMSKPFANNFIDELRHWDGSTVENGNGEISITYSCIIKENIDFVQAVSFISGKMSTIDFREEKDNKKKLYRIYICNRQKVGGENISISKKKYNGNVYCVTVDTGLLVVRRNGVAVICGNSVRRGASAVYLPVEHLDIEEFINIRRPTGDANRRCMNLNHGVCITDEWMNSMLSGDTHKRGIWKEILKTRIETGEPYLFFNDNVNKQNPECYKKNNLTVKTSNICNEIYLYTDKDHTFVCCLSSLNLMRWDEWKDTDTVELSIKFLDAVLSEYIEKTEGKVGFEASRASAVKGRAIGLGVLGWHSLLQAKMLPFDSFESMMLNANIFKTIREKAEVATKELAEKLGEPEWCKGFGRRNTHLLAVAPTVSNSTISGGWSAGIEPIAANIFSQKSAKGTFIRKNKMLEVILDAKGKNTTDVWKTITENSGSVHHLSFLSKEEKEVFLTAREINQFAIIKQAAQRQRFIDQGQSVNLFFGNNSSPKYINEVHLEAWKQGLKGLYYCRTEGVLKGDLASRSKEDCSSCEG